jgi:dTDP-glucose 4,6-dehydratase
MSKRVLFTGHGGFVGHHCLEYFLKHTDWELICIDSFRHKGTCRRVVEVGGDNPRVKTYKHDLSVPIDPQLENLIFERELSDCPPWHTGGAHIDEDNYIEKPIDLIINMASESAVERSTTDPTACVRNNVDLTLNMLEFARRCKGLQQFIQISTDEVYGEAPPDGVHKEWSNIMPSNPYAASKAAQEALAISYWRTYNLPITITNTMNLIGERQDPEKFLPKIIGFVAQGKEMPIYGDSEDSIGSRIYLHAKDMADALVFLADQTPKLYSNFVKANNTWEARPDRYNIVGDEEVNNLELAKMVSSIIGKDLQYKLIPSESARPGYDRRYGLDGSKMLNMGWKHPLGLKKSLEEIVNWTMKNPHWAL